ncbi:uncharacterized protein LOC120625416 [Pararge aegeria]|uniref:Jg4497 protein n=1 Tax=Pararge aegeria aegeria TaxID=348720 RepID=A0A8S4QE92_9NEOP|nr:uncharacterized protein LOC120625416 [Pararge aegeria]XP_039748412.1 uncharacterized protein LOC120625416 [Pararge aegeria]CAH2208960.1 jg4497 [Pararge aegeria aegeria]
MFRKPHNPRARRRLFEADDLTEARIDNFVNVLKESAKRDLVEKSRKWNFDFANEVPLEGTYEWFSCTNTDTAEWVGVKSEKACDKNEDSCLPIKAENEITPRCRDDDALPILRKRRRNAEVVTDKAVRRKISFE